MMASNRGKAKQSKAMITYFAKPMLKTKLQKTNIFSSPKQPLPQAMKPLLPSGVQLAKDWPLEVQHVVLQQLELSTIRVE